MNKITAVHTLTFGQIFDRVCEIDQMQTEISHALYRQGCEPLDEKNQWRREVKVYHAMKSQNLRVTQILRLIQERKKWGKPLEFAAGFGAAEILGLTA